MKIANEQFNKQDEISKKLKIGEVAKISGVGIEALRFYEKSGLLGKPMRTAGGYRVYDNNVIERLSFIKKAQLLGFSLNEIRHIIHESNMGQSPCADVRRIVREKLVELDNRLRDLKRYRKELAETLADWDKKVSENGDICGLIESSKIESKQIITPITEHKFKTKNKR